MIRLISLLPLMLVTLACTTPAPSELEQSSGTLQAIVGTPRVSPVVATTPAPPAVPRIQVVFTQRPGDHPDVIMAEGIHGATRQVDAALYALNRKLTVEALVEAQRRCACVRLISDSTQSGGTEQKAALALLQGVGIPIKTDHHAGLMHLKMVLIDQATVFEGSFNATNAASTINDEVLFRIEDSDIATQVSEEYERMWSDTRRFSDWSPAVQVTPKVVVP